MTAPSLEAVDAALAKWRGRLAAASRNVSELSELPEFAAARAAAGGAGRLAAEARGLVATMDELWQGVLLIGATLDRAETARKSGSRLWRGEEAAAEAMTILEGQSISVDLADTPVLHRSLLAGARETAVVSPGTLLGTMEAAFDSARERLSRISEATQRAAALQGRLAALVAGVPGDWAARLAAPAGGDALDRLEALEAVRPGVEAAAAAWAEVRRAGVALAALREDAVRADAAGAACRAAVVWGVPEVGDLGELGAWLERIKRTLEAGRAEACAIGLENWWALHGRLAAAVAARAAAAAAGLERLRELRARHELLRAKGRGHPGAGLAGLDAAAAGVLAGVPCDLDAAAAALRAYAAGLAG